MSMCSRFNPRFIAPMKYNVKCMRPLGAKLEYVVLVPPMRVDLKYSTALDIPVFRYLKWLKSRKYM